MKGGAGCCGGEGWREGGEGKGEDVTRGTVTDRADACGVTARMGMGKRHVWGNGNGETASVAEAGQAVVDWLAAVAFG